MRSLLIDAGRGPVETSRDGSLARLLPRAQPLGLLAVTPRRPGRVVVRLVVMPMVGALGRMVLGVVIGLGLDGACPVVVRLGLVGADVRLHVGAGGFPTGASGAAS